MGISNETEGMQMLKGTTIQWEATKYGKLIYRHDYAVDGNNITLKIYEYQEKLIQELWNNGICICCHEVI
jgi:hypothetical protein